MKVGRERESAEVGGRGQRGKEFSFSSRKRAVLESIWIKKRGHPYG